MPGKKSRPGSKSAFHDSDKLWAFASDAIDFCGEGIWVEFLAHMKRIGYSEDEVDEMTDAINIRAGRS